MRGSTLISIDLGVRDRSQTDHRAASGIRLPGVTLPDNLLTTFDRISSR